MTRLPTIACTCILLFVAAIGLSACRSSINADEIIGNTLGGREGEIRALLRGDLSAEDKVALGHYLAAVEAQARDGQALARDVEILRMSSRLGANEVVQGLRGAAERARSQGDAFANIEPPDAFAVAHREVVDGYAALGAAIDGYEQALAALDYDSLARQGTPLQDAAGRLNALFRRIELQVQDYVVPGKSLKLRY